MCNVLFGISPAAVAQLLALLRQQCHIAGHTRLGDLFPPHSSLTGSRSM